MIGQIKLQDTINNYKSDFPRFSIVVGPKGSGKRTICKEISKRYKLKQVQVGTKIDDIRNAIDLAYSQYDPILFVIADADNMSVAAKNSLLKITEEPPKSSYFVMTLQSIENTLPTIKSRGTVFTLNPYSKEELIEYRKYRKYSDLFDEVIKLICTNTGQVDELFGYKVDEFYGFCNTVVKNIQIPKSGNAFKITQKIKIKDTDEGYDIELFLNACKELFFQEALKSKKKEYLEASLATAEAMRKLKNVAVSRLGILDMWIISVRALLREI